MNQEENNSQIAVIATLCEGDYWKGVGALANSLHIQGFRGRLWVGYRGALPEWAAGAKEDSIREEERETKCWVWNRKDSFSILFLPLQTTHCLTHYKPEFLLRIVAQEPDGARFYMIDSDLTLAKSWLYFESWVDRGVAVCEDINAVLLDQDPRRIGWRRFFAPLGYRFERHLDLHCNGGFVGVNRKRVGFIILWKALIDGMAEEVGGLERWISIRTETFTYADQDALNIALMSTSESIEIAPQGAMGFFPGELLLPHAIGPRKPWRRPWFWPSLLGRVVAPVDENYWNVASGPIPICSVWWAAVRRFDMHLGKRVAGWRAAWRR